jgi:hypothetical protein
MAKNRPIWSPWKEPDNLLIIDYLLQPDTMTGSLVMHISAERRLECRAIESRHGKGWQAFKKGKQFIQFMLLILLI